jgi:hypothetical protein
MGSFELDGASIVVKPDFAWRDEAEAVHVVDWKTGRARLEEDRQQVALYGLFARNAWGLRDQALCGHVAYLDGGEVHAFVVTDAELAAVEQFVRDSLHQMRKLAGVVPDGDLDPPAFPRTDDLATCRLCPFRRPCGRG